MPYMALVGNKVDMSHLRAVKSEKHTQVSLCLSLSLSLSLSLYLSLSEKKHTCRPQITKPRQRSPTKNVPKFCPFFYPS